MRLPDSNGGTNYLIPVSNGLLTPEHVHRIGSAVWLFLWYIDHTTKEAGGFGLVHGGKPVPDSEPAGALGLDRWTVRRYRRQLEQERYVKTKRTGTGYQVWVVNSKKRVWERSAPESEKCDPATSEKCKSAHEKCSSATSRSDNHKDSSPRSKKQSSERSTSSSKAQTASDQAKALADLLRAKILENNPKAKVPAQRVENWGLEADRMMKIDGRTEAEIRELIEWSQGDPFWQSNILSMKKLREKFDQLTLKAGGGRKHGASTERRDGSPGKAAARSGISRQPSTCGDPSRFKGVGRPAGGGVAGNPGQSPTALE